MILITTFIRTCQVKLQSKLLLWQTCMLTMLTKRAWVILVEDLCAAGTTVVSHRTLVLVQRNGETINVIQLFSLLKVCLIILEMKSNQIWSFGEAILFLIILTHWQWKATSKLCKIFQNLSLTNYKTIRFIQLLEIMILILRISSNFLISQITRQFINGPHPGLDSSKMRTLLKVSTNMDTIQYLLYLKMALMQHKEIAN